MTFDRVKIIRETPGTDLLANDINDFIRSHSITVFDIKYEHLVSHTGNTLIAIIHYKLNKEF